ncbi:hypothetical protein V5O48_014878 [Marasmius crinis-equi]|uniref:Ribonuclease H1 N-terminal domain-containing protein n=1 Tax=Marasmius crinis-equi TaxID=585013 RepID=A0ABR3EW21_9AGAR
MFIFRLCDEETSSDNPDHDVDWETVFSGVWRTSPSLPPVPAPTSASSPPTPLLQLRSLTVSSSPPSEPPAYEDPVSPDPPAYEAPTPTELEELESYYLQRYGGVVPRPDELRRSTNRTSKHFVVCKGRRVGVFGDWSTVSAMVTGVSGANYKKWGTFEEAVEAYTAAYRARMVEVAIQRAR